MPDSPPPILFLDIDGVLIAYPEGAPTAHSFTPRCLRAFLHILEAVPNIRVVFSSTWRYPKHVPRLHQEWLAAGLDASLAIDQTPDLSNDDSISRLHRRGHEINHWLNDNPLVTEWVALDDDRAGIEPVLDPLHCVFTNPQRGLEFADAERVINILQP